MKAAISLPRRRGFTPAGTLAVSFLVACVLALGGCGGTKVYSTDKTVVYRDSLYNMGNVQRIGSRIDGQLADGTTVNMTNLDKKGVEGLLKENGEVTVSMLIEMDAQELVYLRSRVSKYSEYSKMKSRFEGAQKDITRFMGDKKKTQLKLK
jgi:hypothetical protein